MTSIAQRTAFSDCPEDRPYLDGLPVREESVGIEMNLRLRMTVNVGGPDAGCGLIPAFNANARASRIVDAFLSPKRSFLGGKATRSLVSSRSITVSSSRGISRSVTYRILHAAITDRTRNPTPAGTEYDRAHRERSDLVPHRGH